MLQATPAVDELLDLSIDQLMRIPVTTASRSHTELADTPAAAFVITAEDFARAGVTSLPEALRLVPGMQVAQIEANKWAVASRGYAGRFAYQMQVLVDGRSVYSTLFSGTPWEALNIPIDTVERIEVIRGPGGAVWGSNAVNGVVNIITRKTTPDPHTHLTVGIGTERRGYGLLAQDGPLGDNGSFRFYIQGFDQDSGKGLQGLDSHDDWREGCIGLRLDWDLTARDRLTFQGSHYRGVIGETLLVPDPTVPAQWPGSIAIPEDADTSGGYAMLDWEHTFAADSRISLRAFTNYDAREELSLDDRRRTHGIEFEHHLSIGQGRHRVAWGAGYTVVLDHTTDTSYIQYSANRQKLDTFGLFVQDEIALVPERLSLTLGSRFELTDRNGWETQPTARLAYTPSSRQTYWLAVSRSVRVPSRMELTARRNFAQGLTLVGEEVWDYTAHLVASSDLQPEELIAYEVGARFLLAESLSLDVACFYHGLSDSVLDVSTYGVEAALRYRPKDWWQLDLSYSFIRVQMHPQHGPPHLNDDWYEKDAPRHQLGILSTFQLRRNVDLSLWARYVDNINDVAGYQPDAYVTLDANIRWQISPRCELLLAGYNLLESNHTEYYPSSLLPTATTAVQRAAYAQISYRF
jgi:iron complex outermembrane receptor protein